MPALNEAESPEHKKLVRGLMDYLTKEGFRIVCAANVEGYNQCEPIEDRIPDVMGKNTQELLAIAEAKSCDDLDNDRTNDQFKIFSSRIMAVGSSKEQTVPFYVGIPKTCIEQLQTRLGALGLSGKTNIHIIWFDI
jgi:hypothetical protein